MPKSYGLCTNFYNEILPKLDCTDNDEMLFLGKLESICYLLNNVFGDYNVIITGTLASFLHNIRLKEHQNNEDIDILLINDIDDDYEKYQNLIIDNIHINIKLHILPQAFERHFFSINEYIFNETHIFVETPESLLIDKARNIESNINDIQLIKSYISNKNDFECVSLIKALNEIFAKLNIQYVIAGSYSLWMQGVELQREFGHDVDIILMCDITDEILKNVINNEELKYVLYSYGINKELDFVDKHPVIDDYYNKINFQGYDVYVTNVQNFIQTKIRYIREQRSKNNVIKSKFDLLCLSNIDEYKSIINNYSLLDSVNDSINKINNIINLEEDKKFYIDIKNKLNIIVNDLIKKCHDTNLRIGQT